MPVTTHITLDMCHDEILRIYKVMQKSYPEQVSKGKITPYTRDHRLQVMEKILELFKTAKSNKSTKGPNFLNLLNNLPNE